MDLNGALAAHAEWKIKLRAAIDRYYGASATRKGDSAPKSCGMTEIRTVTALRSKRAEIISSIASDEKRLAQARADLSHVNARIALFAVTGEAGAIPVPPYVDTHRMFARGELMKLCKEALTSGPKATKATTHKN
jgi:hypothetical protein